MFHVKSSQIFAQLCFIFAYGEATHSKPSAFTITRQAGTDIKGYPLFPLMQSKMGIFNRAQALKVDINLRQYETSRDMWFYLQSAACFG